MFTIHLNNLKFHSFHGIYEEEKILGNDFEVNVMVSFLSNKKITSIKQTVDYAKIFNIINQRMKIPTALLETLAQDVVDKIYELDNNITSINISIKKLNPPIEAFTGHVGVIYKKDF